MEEEELRRRLSIVNNHRVSELNQMQLRGGMQDRLKRQEILKHGKDIKNKRKKIKNKLSQIEKERQAEGFDGFSENIEPLDNFNEPAFRRIRTRTGFFNL